MAFTSYAQNFEDVILWRALKHIENGTYVDVGAQHPTIDSVSKAFYDRGWRGIHIEPVPMYAQMLRNERPDEVILEVAITDQPGIIELNVISGTGLSTAVDHYAIRHQAEHGHNVEKINVPTITIMTAVASLLDQNVHWLKIDVEGLETQVLKGWNYRVLRPWIMVVEATIPNSTGIDTAGWEDILAKADYDLVYFDGLNRFYLAREHSDLKLFFSTPPNVFDDIRLTRNSIMLQGIEVANESTIAAEALSQIVKMQNEIALLDDQIWKMQHSRSWRITRPLRLIAIAASGIFRQFKTNPPAEAMRQIIRSLIRRTKQWIFSHPRIFKITMLFFSVTPGVKIYPPSSRKITSSPGAHISAQKKDQLSMRAAQIYEKFEARQKNRES